MKIIFLDIDGVLNTSQSIGLRERKVTMDDLTVGFNRLDRRAVDNLNKVIDATGAKIVISSSWRIGCVKPEMFAILCKHLREEGVKGQVIGRTPTDMEYSPRTPEGYTLFIAKPRGDEIQMWLDAHPIVDSFTIVDDCSDMEHLTHRLVQTEFEVGITEHDADRMINMLNGTIQ